MFYQSTKTATLSDLQRRTLYAMRRDRFLVINEARAADALQRRMECSDRYACARRINRAIVRYLREA